MVSKYPGNSFTTPFARKSTQIYGDLRRFWEKEKIKESAKKPGITGFYRLIIVKTLKNQGKTYNQRSLNI